MRVVRSLTLFVFGFLAMGSLAHAETRLSAELNRATTSLDESVLFSVELSTDEAGGLGGEPTFSAPDFDILSTQEGQTSRTMITPSGLKLSLTLQRSYILRPKKTGVLTIRGIEWKVRGQSYTAPGASLHVTPAGAGSAPPPRYGGAGSGLRGAGKPNTGKNFFIRAETNTSRAYVGEQIIVSYNLYQRVMVSSPEMKKYPALEGFLKEELEMPIIRTGLTNYETVVVDGIPYRKTLLMRFAAYPLKAGPATLDPTTMSARFFAQTDSFGSQFGQLFQMFGMGTEQQQTVSSEPVPIQVRELPTPQPSSFRGGVGELTIDAAADKTELKTGESMQLIVKVEGRGNLSSMEAPKLSWPDGIEQYDVKATSKSVGGYGQRIFTYTLVPKKPGEFSLPGATATWFNPKSEDYVTRTTEPFRLRVTGEEIRTTAPVAPATPEKEGAGLGVVKPEKLELKPKEPGTLVARAQGLRLRLTGILQVAVWLLAALLLGGIGFDLWGADRALRERERRSVAKQARLAWKTLASRGAQVRNPSVPFEEVVNAYSDLEEAILEALQKLSGLPSRGLARVDLGHQLVTDRGVRREIWTRVEKVLEFCETARFIASTRVYPESDARSRFESWVHEAERSLQELETELRPRA